MTPDTIPQSVLFPDLFDKPLVATFNQEHASSDGGAVLLKAAERVYGLVKAFARCLADKRAPGKIRHTLADLIGQRVFGIACGHPDGNDADHLADDPIHKLLLGRDPVSGAPLASQPTISRFENGARRSVLYRMGRELAASVIERHRRRLQGRARRITIDLDPTDDLTHGAQQLTFFNGHYGGWCYLPMLGFLSFDREAVFSVNYFCRLASTIFAGSGRRESRSTTMTPVGRVGVACDVQSGVENALPRRCTVAPLLARVFHAAGAVHRLLGFRSIPAFRRSTVGGRGAAAGPGARPRGAGAAGDFRRDRSVW